mgnify:FL=1
MLSRGSLYTILNGIAQLVKAVSSLIINKITVVFLGPSALLLVGNLKSVYVILQQMSGAGIYEGAVKYISGEYKNRISFILQACMSLMLIGLTTSLLIYILFSAQIFDLLQLDDSDHLTRLWLTGGVIVGLLCFMLYTLFQSFFHGQKEYKTVVLNSFIASLLSLGVSIPLIYFHGILGLIISVFVPSITLFISYMLFVPNAKRFVATLFVKPVRFFVFRPLLSYALMSAIAAIVFPSVLIVIRVVLVQTAGVELASFWEGYSKFSMFISSLAISSISLYYLPKLVEAKTGKELRQVVLWGAKFLVAFALPALLLVYALGDKVIPLLYTTSFLEAFYLLKWELFGTFLKLLSFTMSFIMIAKRLTRLFIVSELVSGLVYLMFSLLFVNIYGTVGASIAFAATYLLYLIWATFYFSERFKFFEKD